MTRRMAIVALAFSAGIAHASESNYHIVAPNRPLSAGEAISLKLVPDPPAGARVSWGFEGQPMGILQAGRWPEGTYYAPYVIAPGAPPVVIYARVFESKDAKATTEIRLSAGAVPGSEDCLGPGQEWSLHFVYMDRLPEAIRRVTPTAPPGFKEETRTVMVNALVCKNGNVLDAIYQPTSSSPREQPVELDRRLVQAAVEAARKWQFTPGTVNGQPMATWIVVPIRFSE